jgi:hypothetical protein
MVSDGVTNIHTLMKFWEEGEQHEHICHRKGSIQKKMRAISSFQVM